MTISKKNPTPTIIKRAQSRFIQIDEICIEKFTIYAMSVYQQLRLLSDFTKAYDEIEITVPSLAKLSKMSERKVYEALNELEHEHGVIQRLNYHHFRYGKVNSYNVARDYNYFNVEQVSHTPACRAGVVDNPVQSFTTPAPHAGTPAPHAGTPAPNAYLSTLITSLESSHIKQNKEPVSVFFETDSVKTKIEKTIANRGMSVEEDVILQIIFYIGLTTNYKDVMKKINIALKKVREGKWNIPQGYKGITSQSIREKEDDYQRNKEQQYQQEAKAMKTIVSSVANGDGFKGFSDMVKKMRRDIC